VITVVTMVAMVTMVTMVAMITMITIFAVAMVTGILVSGRRKAPGGVEGCGRTVGLGQNPLITENEKRKSLVVYSHGRCSIIS
jgi:hypothetical protein